MSGDKGPEHFDDDEYHLEDDHFDDENHPSFDEEPPKKKKSWRDFIGKRVIVILGIIVAIIIVYKFLAVKNAATQQADLGLDQQDTNAAQISAVPSAPTGQNQGAQSAAIQAQVQSLSEQNAKDTTQIQSVQADVARLNDTMNQLQLSLNTLNQSLASLSTDVTTIKTSPDNKVVSCGCGACGCGAKEAPVKHRHVRRYYGPGIVYHLKAVVPGRAWIQSNTGMLTTVKVGDSLSGYGVVKAINATQGWVGTSSGRIIQYGPYDS
jgi:intracellular multiplication protein IcmG